MTTTQTTYDRVERIFANAVRNYDAMVQVAEIIDALQERNAFLLTSAETAQANLEGCRRELEQCRAQRDGAYVAHHEVNEELIRAQAEVEKLTHSLALANAIAAGKPIQYVGPLEGMKESLEASYRSALDESARQMGQARQWLSEAGAQNQEMSRKLAECRAEVERLENARWDQG